MSDQPLTVYTSTFCAHAWAVERFLKKQAIPVNFINIDDDPLARAKVMELNHGYASVPTLIFPDGTQLTEPSFGQLRQKLGLQQPGLFTRIKRLFGAA